jgi:PEP-CTERM motif
MNTQKTLLLLIYVTILVVSTAPAAIIPGLFNTGVNNNDERSPAGSLEQHYVLTGEVSPAYVYDANATLITDGMWATPPADSMWIGSGEPGVVNPPVEPPGSYNYTLTFDLTGLDPASAWISGKWASDNGSTINLNGVYTGYTKSGINGDWTYVTAEFFTISAGFLSGVNTLEFQVNNIFGQTGLLVQDLHGESVPEPAALLLFGLGGLAAIRRRRTGRN